MFYRVMNRTAEPKRLRFFKRGPVNVIIPNKTFPTYQENTIQFGWCLKPNTPIKLPLTGDVKESMYVYPAPFSVNGRVSLLNPDGSLRITQRYTNLQSDVQRKNWFNREFGAHVKLEYLKELPEPSAVFTAVTETIVMIEDDDYNYIAGPMDIGVHDFNVSPRGTTAFERNVPFRFVFHVKPNKATV